ncbi:MAG TPA: hypothetical protein DCQ31_06450 [Bacteroidales bacterium]|nr:hypothetical protein [Bacteroidales bacterium]
MKNPELLVPVGSREKFWAAIEAGADAVYLGLKNFNARERAANFSYAEIESVIDKAHKKNVKVYITLNTVIKNEELPKLLDTLYFLNEVMPDAVIIQDWGVFKLVSEFFPDLKLHASTQMANHNSLGVQFAANLGIGRVVLARELTLHELLNIRKKTTAELEIFIHGALCYSFSGMCHFSSFITGEGANRGKCTQPCRREYTQDKDKAFVFNLKDNKQLDKIHFFKQIGIDSLKIEGRLKSAEYVYKVAKAYKIAITEPERMAEAEILANEDFGREKTDYFFGKTLKVAIGQNSNVGKLIGSVSKVTRNGFTVSTDANIQKTWRLRIHNLKTDTQQSITVDNFKPSENATTIEASGKFSENDPVYVAGTNEYSFSSKLPYPKNPVEAMMPPAQKRKILSTLKPKAGSVTDGRQTLYLRIDSLDWLRKLYIHDADYLLLRFSFEEFTELLRDTSFLNKFGSKLYIELPYFIPEGALEKHEMLLKRFVNAGISKFMINHLSQKDLIPANAEFAASENVYAYNDAAISFLKSQGVSQFVYPVENDNNNLFGTSHTDGIVPVYFLPRLFISRMPVDFSKDNAFRDKENRMYIKHVKAGITYVVPEKIVSLTQFVPKMLSKGFTKLLIDFSFIKPSRTLFPAVIKRLEQATKIPESVDFNFNKELK